MKSRIGPLAEALAQTWAGIGSISWSLSSVIHSGLTGLFRLITSVVELGVVALTTWSGIPTCGVYWLQLAPLSFTAARTSSRKNSASFEVTGWPSDQR